jgi:hypothetical protein
VTGTTVEQVARAALAEAAPEELEGFALVVAAYRQSPAAVRRAARGSNEPTASATVVAGETLGALTLAVTSGMAQSLLATGVPRMLSKWDPRRWIRRPARPDTPLPPVDPDRSAELEEALADELRLRLDDPLADSMASCLARAWPRSRR